METLIAFLAKYWLEFILGGIAVFLTAKYKQLKKRYDAGKKQEEEEALEPFKQQILDDVQELKEEVLGIVQEKEEEFEQEEKNINHEMKQLSKDMTNTYKEIYNILESSRETSRDYRDLYQKALLYNMRKYYFIDCEKLLDPTHIITFDEFSQITADHTLYNELGGNHQGDIYFKAVEDKYHNQTHQ